MTPKEISDKILELQIQCRSFKWWAPEALVLTGWTEGERHNMKRAFEEADEALRQADESLQRARAHFETVAASKKAKFFLV